MKHVHPRREMPLKDIRIELFYPQISVLQSIYSMYGLQRGRDLALAHGQSLAVEAAGHMHRFEKRFLRHTLVADCSVHSDIAPRKRWVLQNLRDLPCHDEPVVLAINER